MVGIALVVGMSRGGLNVMSLGVTYVDGLLIFRVKCSFSCSYNIGAHLLRLGAARSSIVFIPLAVRSPCCLVVILSRFSDMLCVIGGVSDSGVGVSEIFIPVSSRCRSRLRSQQFGVSAVGRCSGPPWNRPHCGCGCLCGLISSPAAIFAVSSD